MQNTFILENSVITGGKDTTENTTTSTGDTSTETTGTSSSPAGSFSMVSLVVIYAVVIAAMYYFTIRPARKREKLIQAKQDEIRLGDEVVTTSGMHGKVVNINATTFNVEFGTNKGVIIPVNKKDVLPVNTNIDEKPSKAAKTDSNETK